jgi:putative flippase GtrA
VSDQFARFVVVGASGYALNLAVYSLFLKGFGVHYAVAAAFGFVAAVANNYTWHRLWTFRDQRGHLVYQAGKFLLVCLGGLGGNLLVLSGLVAVGVGEIAAQALAVAALAPLTFLANKFWSFRVALP